MLVVMLLAVAMLVLLRVVPPWVKPVLVLVYLLHQTLRHQQ